MYISSKYVFGLVAVFSFTAIICGVYGYHWCMNGYSMDDAVYRSLMLFVLNDTSIPQNCIYVNIARFLAPVAVILGGLQALQYISKNGFEWLYRLVLKNQIVICGVGTTGMIIYDILRKQSPKSKFILVDINTQILLHPKRSFWISGDASSPNVISKMKITSAKAIYIVTGDDYINLMILQRIIHTSSTLKTPIYVRLENEDVKQWMSAIDINVSFEIKVFNISESVTRKFIHIKKKHIAILGLGSFGQCLLKTLNKDNYITVFEQSKSTVDRFNANNPDVGAYNKRVGDLWHLRKNDIKGLKSDIIFVCMGGEWQSFITTIRWRKMFPDSQIILLSNSVLGKDEEEHFLLTENKIDICRMTEYATAQLCES